MAARMLQGLQLSSFPSSSPQAEHHHYCIVVHRQHTVETHAFFREKLKSRSQHTREMFTHHQSSPPPPLLASRTWATTEEGRGKNKMAAQPACLTDSKPSQPPPTLHMQDLKHLPDGCWLLIRTVSSQRPAGKPAGSLELASRSLPSFLE